MMNMKNGKKFIKALQILLEEGFLAVANSFDKIAQIEKNTWR